MKLENLNPNDHLQFEIKEGPFAGVTVLVTINDFSIDYDGHNPIFGGPDRPALDHLEAQVFIPAIEEGFWMEIPYLTNQVNDGWMLHEEIEEILLVNEAVPVQEPEYREDLLPRKGTKGWGKLQGEL